MIKPLLVALLLAAPLAAHAQEKPVESDYAAQQSAAVTGLKVEDGWGWIGDMRWRRVKGDGTGAHPTAVDTVKIHYEGTLTDGTKFDSSWDRGEPAVFPLGRLIKAWQLAVPMAGVGDTIEIAVPSSLGYGPKGKGPIPGHATMFFKIELLGIEGQ